MESAVCWSRPLLHPDTAGLDSTPIAEGKWMGGWTTVSFFNPDIQSELQTGIPLRPQRLPTSPQFLSSHQLLPTRKPSRPWCQSQRSSYSIVTQWPRRPRVTAKFYLWPPKCKADNRTCSFSVCCHDSSGGNSARPGFWPKTEQNKRKGPLFWSQLEILTKAKPMTGRSLRQRCLHPVGGINVRSVAGRRLAPCLSWILSLLMLHQGWSLTAAFLSAKHNFLSLNRPFFWGGQFLFFSLALGPSFQF